MNKEKKGIGTFLVITIMIVLVLIAVFVGVWTNYMHIQNVAEECRDAADGFEDKSNDYIQGWMDAIDYFEWELTKPTNTTAAGMIT